MNEKLNVVFTSDENYMSYFGVACASLIENNKDILGDIFLIHNMQDDEILNKYVNFFKEKYGVDLQTLYFDGKNFEEYKISDYYSIVVYFRLLLAEILPKDIKKVLYLDSDMVIDGSLKELLELDFSEDTYLYAVDEVNAGTKNACELLKTQGFEIEKYFNAGMTYISLEKIKQKDKTKTLLQNAIKYNKQVRFQDQDILNITFRHDKQEWKTLDYTYNTYGIQNLYKKQTNFTYPKIIHYTSYSKPWYFYDKHPLRNAYWKYRKLFFDEGLKALPKSKHKSLKRYITEKSHQNIASKLLDKKSQLVLYPAGAFTEEFLKVLPKKLQKQVIICDKNKQGQRLKQIKIQNIKEVLKKYTDVKILITSFTFGDEILKYLLTLTKSENVLAFRDVLNLYDHFIFTKTLKLPQAKYLHHLDKIYHSMEDEKSKIFFEYYLLSVFLQEEEFIKSLFESDEYFTPPFVIKKDDVLLNISEKISSDDCKYSYQFIKKRKNYEKATLLISKKALKNLSIFLNEENLPKDVKIDAIKLENAKVKEVKKLASYIKKHKPKIQISSSHDVKNIIKTIKYLQQFGYKVQFRFNEQYNLDNIMIYFKV